MKLRIKQSSCIIVTTDERTTSRHELSHGPAVQRKSTSSSIAHSEVREHVMTLSGRHTYLFGGDKPWLAEPWVASDDRVRGGKSQSYLDYASGSSQETVRFYGELDTTALGGAGFASQRSPDSQHWDLSNFEGLHLAAKKGDGKKYTFIVKDEILPKRPDGREQSTVSWEYDFIGNESGMVIRWKDLKPTYRGKPKPDAKPLDLASIRRISIMMRSFFGQQEGSFDLELQHIAAARFGEQTELSGSGTPAKVEYPNSDSSLSNQKENLTGLSLF